jgi:uncharacterized OB-fold protein
MRTGTVHTETVVHAAPERFAADAPYQVVIVELETGERIVGRSGGDRVSIGDRVVEADLGGGVPIFRKI